jgi:hypothetical protein
MSIKTQSDFACLDVTINSHISSLHKLVDHETLLQRGIAKATRLEKRVCVDEEYVPVNFIKAEAYALIAAWEACESERKEWKESAESNFDAHSDALYEPSRSIPAFSPPKQFYRTFWRSITRRTLEHSRKSIAARPLQTK